MNIQLKQKIIGAVIIVVFLAIAIPFLFSGTTSKNNENISALSSPVSMQDASKVAIPVNTSNTSLAAQTSSGNNNSVLETDYNLSQQKNSVQIPQQNLTKTAVSDVSQGPGAVPLTNAAAGNITNNTNAANSNTVNASYSNKTEQASEPVSSKISTSSLEQSSHQKQSSVISNITYHNAHKNIKTKTTGKRNNVKQNVTKSIDHKIFSISLGAYSNSKRVQNLVSKLKKDGYHTYTRKIKVKHRQLIMVLVGPVKGNEKAKRLAHKISKNFAIKSKII